MHMHTAMNVYTSRIRAFDMIHTFIDSIGYTLRKYAEGVIWGPKWVHYLHAPRAGGPNWHVSSSALLCRFQCSWAWNGQVRATCLSSRGVNPIFEKGCAVSDQPEHQTERFLSSHMLYLTSQRNKLSDFWAAVCCIWPASASNWVIFSVLKSLQRIKIIARGMGQNEQVVGEICKPMCRSPWKAPI